MKPIVSVIIPTFNRSGSLPAAIISVLTQTYQNIEVIVVDDCSNEDIASVVAGLDDKRLRYIRREVNGGAAAARNTGLAQALGNYIAFQDSDDIWLPGKLERQMDLLLSLPCRIGVVTGSKIIYGRDSNFEYGVDRVAIAPSPGSLLRTDDDQVSRLLAGNRLSVQNALFRKDCYPGCDWFDTCARANEDWEFAIRLAQHTTIHEEQTPVVLGFVSPDSISRSGRKEIIGHLRILRKNRALLRSFPSQRSALLLGLSKYLYHQGKRKSARKFLMSGLCNRPTMLGSVLAGVLRLTAKRWFHERQAAGQG